MKQFLPINFESSEAGKGCVLLVQGNYYECGGMAVGLCLSHKIADAAALSTFIRSWAATGSGFGDERVVIPLYNSVAMATPKDISVDPPADEMIPHKSVTKRYVFHGSKIAAQKARVANNFVENPTEVEALAALIWK
ncbi:hypothetical protein ACFXTI_021126 [Malus domestica]|uniref:Uncharacterized protein n=1 Tax=Malus domestica TaxID=3750 RepID=A0A498HSU8_MALDO|nr:hypothetical protein DVH24_033759 [Malus domestica]